MNWKLPNDDTEPVITAQKHIASSHGDSNTVHLPETCVIFEMGMAVPFIEEHFSAYTMIEHIPGFITDSKCIGIENHTGACFLTGGYGAPAAVDTLETVLALGVKRVIVLGMCGGFSANIRVGDVIVPYKIFCEEGTSQHYLGNVEYVTPDETLQKTLASWFTPHFHVLEDPTVSTDAVYRQTMAKEADWRSRNCVAVDMEASALLAVCRYYAVPASVAFICSDRHPLPGQKEPWRWGNCDFREKRQTFVRHGVSYALQNF